MINCKKSCISRQKRVLNIIHMIPALKPPLVSIGVPVCNGEETLEASLHGLIKQSYSNIEIIISDNASDDRTESICHDFCSRFAFIRYFRFNDRISADKNFILVLQKSVGTYFMWTAADDIRSPNFVCECVSILELNPSCVAATGQDRMVTGSQLIPTSEWRTFDITGDLETRINKFLNISYYSNGLFYSLIRTSIAKEFNFKLLNGFASDWIFIMHLISRGEILRSGTSYTLLSDGGLSNSNKRWSAFRTSLLFWLFPLSNFIKYTLLVSSSLALFQKVRLCYRLCILNLVAASTQIKFELKLVFNPSNIC